MRKICRLEEIPCKTLAPEAVERAGAVLLAGKCPPTGKRRGDGGGAQRRAGPCWTPAIFRSPRRRAPAARAGAAPIVSLPDQGMDYEQTMAVIERSILEQALQKTGGNKKAAADMLRLKRTTLSAKVRSLEPSAACN